MTMCPVRRLSSALQGGFLLQILQNSLYSKRVRLCKTSTTHYCREYNISRVQSADNFCNMIPRHHPVIISNRFSACCFEMRSHWHVLSKQRSCPLIMGFSSTRAWVTQPFHWYDSLAIGRFSGLGGGVRYPLPL